MADVQRNIRYVIEQRELFAGATPAIIARC
jgi:hypothetical protein